MGNGKLDLSANLVQKLPHRVLGDTEIDVSILGLGTVKFGRNSALRYPRTFALPTDAQIVALLGQAQDAGLNLIDTAPAYGSAEQRIGKLLPGLRAGWVISTKVGETFRAGESEHDFTEGHTRASVIRSLRDLRSDYLDIVLMHCPDDDLQAIEHSDCLETLAALKQAGTIRAFGASTKTLAGTLSALRVCGVVMLPGAPDDKDLAVCLDHTARYGIGVLIKKALASGNSSAAQMNQQLRWLTSQTAVSSVVVGTIDSAHLAAHCASVIR